jgi:DNA-binding SARP family transcriptional activator/tetratricopeptide (TPR) repeat protein
LLVPDRADFAPDDYHVTRASVRLQIMGPLRIWRDGVELDPGPAQQVALFAVLLLNVGKPTSIDKLVDTLWEDKPPQSALNTIHKYVGALRHLLEPDLRSRESGAFLQRRGEAYVFIADQAALDLTDFRAKVDQARVLTSQGEDVRAMEVYLEALSLWHGRPGAGSSRAAAAASLFDAVNAELTGVVLEASTLAVSTGEPARLLPALRFAASLEPFHEPLHAALISTLGVAGQQAEALSVFRDVRVRLAEDLGLDPGAALTAAYQRLLAPAPAPVLAPATTDLWWKRSEQRAQLVGRSDEVERLWGAAVSALQGDSGVAVLEGEPGIGKTRILEAISVDAEKHGMVVAWGRCAGGEGAPALWPWIEVLSTIRQAAPGADDAGLAMELDLLSESPDDVLSTPVMPDTGAKFRLFERLISIIADASAQRPVLVIVDDLHGADSTSLELFGHLARRIPRGVAIIGSLRHRAPAPAADLTSMLAEVSRSAAHRRVRLHGLSADEVADLVRNELGPHVNAAVTRGLHDRSAGNPFFALELARLVTDDAQPEEPVSHAVPSTVVDVVRDRMHVLDPSATAMLQVAAAIGGDIFVRVLAKAAGVDEQTCLDRIQEAENLGFIDASPTRPGVVRFSHDVVRESVMETTPHGKRQQMHLDIADALQNSRLADDLGVERFAHHLWSAGPLADPARTVSAMVRAGRITAAKCAFEASEYHLQLAVQTAREAGLKEDELTALAELISVVGMKAGYLGAAAGQLERAEGLARQLGRDREAADFLFSRFTACCQSIQLDEAGRLARRLLEHGQHSGDPIVRAYGWTAWGVYQWDVGGIGESQEFLARAGVLDFDLEAAREGWPLRRDLQMLWPAWMANTSGVHGDLETARTILDGLDAAAQDDPYAVTVWAAFSIVTAALAGDASWASQVASRALSVDPEWSFGFLGLYVRLGMCWARAVSGDSAAEMATAAQQMVSGAMENPPASGLPTWYCLIAEMRLAAGQLDEASQAMDKADHYFTSYGQRYAEGLLVLLRAQLMKARGVPAPLVRATAERARTLSVERGAGLFARRAEAFSASVGADTASDA